MFEVALPRSTFSTRPTSPAYPIHEDLSDDHWNKTQRLKNLYFLICLLIITLNKYIYKNKTLDKSRAKVIIKIQQGNEKNTELIQLT